ncbi:MAG: hypothetical protein ILP17_09365 [Lachnospiraceae bacterium]|nr:hypothetical protein [Lachnospiraceae bacterium]
MKNFIYKKKTGYIALLISVLSVYAYRHILTDTGVGYMVCSYLVCMLIWTVLGEGFSDVMARMVRARLSKGQKNNAMNIASMAFVNQLFFGIIGAILCGVLNFKLMSGIIGLPKGRFLGFYLAVFFFFRMINEYFIGYSSVSSGDKAVCISGLVREVFRICLGFLFMKSFYDKGVIESTLLMDEDIRYVHAACGLFIGFCIAEILVFAFLFIVRLGLKLKTAGGYESYSGKDKPVAIFLNLWKKRLGSLVHGAVFSIFLIAAVSIAHDAKMIGTAFNVLLIPFAISLIAAMYSGTAASVSWVNSVRKNEKGMSRSYFDFGVHIVVIASVFCAGFFAAVSKLVGRLLLSEPGMSLSTELRLAVIASVLLSIAYFSDQLCAMRDDRLLRIIADAVAGLLSIIAVRICGGAIQSFYMALTVSVIVYSVVSMIMWCIITYMKMGMVFDPLRNVLIPVVSGAVTAIFLLLITNAAAAHLGNLFTMIMCIPIGLIIYHSVLLLLRNYTDSELKLMPLGGILYSLGQILKVI